MLGSPYSATTWAVTVIEPGAVETPFFDSPPQGALQAEDIAAAVMCTLQQPDRGDVNQVLIRPIAQSL